MKYFKEIVNATKFFLEGKLRLISIENINSSIFKITILYKDRFDYSYDYDFEIDTNLERYSFICHQTINPLFNVDLDRDELFEKEIQGILRKY